MLKTFFTAAMASLVAGSAAAAPVGLDGTLGSEWNGVSAVSVGYNAAAPNGDFANAGNTSSGAAYDIRVRRDNQYVYAFLNTTGAGTSAGPFANLYFSLRYGSGTYGSAGSSIGFEVTNDRAFKPGGSGYFNDTVSDLIQWSIGSGGSTIEAAIALSVFTENALGVTGYGLPPGEVAKGLQLRLSQSFGYSAVGGASYGDSRLGFVDLPAANTVPEPGALALIGLALAAAGWSRRSSAKR